MPITTETRSFRVEINTPKDVAGRTISYHRHTVILDDDGNVIGETQQRPESIVYAFADEAETVIEYVSPLDGKTKPIAIAEIAAAIAQDYANRQASEDAGE